MALALYNSLTRQKEPFRPDQDPATSPEVKFYVCGVTVYDYCHLGHARTYTVWDTLRRYLLWRGYPVIYVQNFTDIDDKILKRAQESEISIHELTQRFIDAYFEDMDRLNIRRADNYPKATGSLGAMIQLVQDLELKEFAYRVRIPGADQAEDVYYEVRKFRDYGQLSGRRLDEMKAGASGRVGSEDSLKRDPFDFALWKSAPRHEPGFESPWGWGRPGWHLECSAMVRQSLGNPIDIHAGGADLIFPHHENELAQSEPIVGQPMARFWLHNGFLNINGEKMSKSLGNFTTLRQALEVWDPMALRLFFLQTHYRSPIDLTEAGLQAASNGWNTLTKGSKAATALIGQTRIPGLQSELGQSRQSELNQPDPDVMGSFQAAMDDDLGTPAALALAFDLAKTLTSAHNTLTHTGSLAQDPVEIAAKSRALLDILDALGFLIPSIASTELTGRGSLTASAAMPEAEIESLLQERAQARKNRDFARADQIRDQLKAEGITLIDQSDGATRWVQEG